MILAIDAGNSQIILGTIENGEIENVVRIHTELNDTPAEYGIKMRQLMEFYGISPQGFEGAIISSVVPPVTYALRSAVKNLTGLESLIVGPGIKTGMNVRIDDPSTLAGDLVVGAVAAIAYYGAPAIILDLGTATSMVVVDHTGCYRGGAFIPGVMLGLQALSSGTSLLPDVSFTVPKKVIATNTADAMRSGALYGTAAMIDGMIERMENELGESCRIIATGGIARRITPWCKRKIICDDNLLLRGLWVLYQKNRK